MPTIAEILRHAPIGPTLQYVKSRSHPSKDMMRRMDEFFVPPPGPPESRPEPPDNRPARPGTDASAETKNPSSEVL